MVHLVYKSYRSFLVINKMAKSLHCCVFLMLTVLAAMCTVAEIISKSVCEGDSVEIFQNISSASFTMITLYKHSTRKNETIALWSVVNQSTIVENIRDRYKPKVLFKNGIIILRNIESADEATYILLYSKENSPMTKEMHISTLVPPTNHCKPKIRQVENRLIAFLDNLTYCGNRIVSIQWMEYPDIYYKDKSVIEIPPGKDGCTFHACIEGETLMCTRNSTEKKYCEHFTIGSIRIDNIPITASDIQYLKPITVATAVLVSLGILALIASLIIKWKFCTNGPKDPEGAPTDEDMSDSSSMLNRNVPDPRQGPVLRHENIAMQEMD